MAFLFEKSAAGGFHVEGLCITFKLALKIVGHNFQRTVAITDVRPNSLRLQFWMQNDSWLWLAQTEKLLRAGDKIGHCELPVDDDRCGRNGGPNRG